jgi:signal transduction histidine kinase
VALFRVVQESLTNIAKHAQAHQVAVRVARDASEVRLSIEDDGDGFDVAAAMSGMGLLGMRERVIALDGRFEFESQDGKGTRIQATIPLSSPALDEAEPVKEADPGH